MVTDTKAILRQRMFELRQGIDPSTAESAAHIIKNIIIEHFSGKSLLVAGYAPMRSELDIMPTLQALHAQGHRIALPVIVAKHTPLQFHAYTPGNRLSAGAYGALQPASGEVVSPDIILVPLLAFDRHRQRLGYGGGYYDRTLAQFPHAKAYGIAYAAQKIDALPTEAHDRVLDLIITEQGIF